MRGLGLLLSIVLGLGCSYRHDVGRAMQFAPEQKLVRDPQRRQVLLAALREIDPMVRGVFETLRMPSLAVAVLFDGAPLWWRTYGTRDRHSDRPVTLDTAYRIGSITKVVTAMAVLRLRDEGRVELDQPASQILPELDRVIYPTRDSPPITLRHMLTHTSGLPRLGRFDYAAKRTAPVSEPEVLSSLARLHLQHAPGTHWEYSNFAYGLLGIAVGRVAGEPFRDYVSRTVFAPLGMRASWDWSAIPGELRATGYALQDGDYQPSHEWLLGASEGMGGIYASLDDMIRWLGFHMTAWPPGRRADREPLASASLREAHMLGGMQPPGAKGTGLGWGVGDFADIGHGVFHTGATTTFAATAMFLPHENIGFLALTNCGAHAGDIDGLGGRVLAALARAGRAKAEVRAK